MSNTPVKAPAEWSALLVEAVCTPGIIAEAYTRFWRYSIGNQLLALWQCTQRGIPPGPITTFVGWKELGRTVSKGQKALTLCMPVTVKDKRKLEKPESESEENGEQKPLSYTRFIYRPNWFTLVQTEGEPYQTQDIPDWSEERALSVLAITRVPFNHLDGNVQGYATGMTVSVSPIAFQPHRTLFHELAHVVLGHTAEAEQVDGEHTPRNLKEVEAESVALICCESLGLSGADHSRGYIQHWLRQETIPERSAHRIFAAADKILRSGRPRDTKERSPITELHP